MIIVIYIFCACDPFLQELILQDRTLISEFKINDSFPTCDSLLLQGIYMYVPACMIHNHDRKACSDAACTAS